MPVRTALIGILLLLPSLAFFQDASPTVTELGEKIERLEARVELLEGLDRHVKQPPEKLDVFKAVVQQSTRGLPNGGYYGDFTTKGPVTASLKSLPRNIGEVVSDGTGKLLFGMGGHELYRLDLSKRKATEIVATGVPEISCAMGLAYDTKRERVVLATLGGEGFLYGYDHKKDSWAVVSSMQYVDVTAIAYLETTDRLYAIGSDAMGSRQERPVLYEYDAESGFCLRKMPIDLPIVGEFTDRALQLIPLGDSLIFVQMPKSENQAKAVATEFVPTMHRINPKTGKVVKLK